LPVGTEAPTFELPDLAGGRKSLVQFRGQPVLLVFFNPDCGYCRELMPKLVAVAPQPVPLPVGRGEGGRSPGEGRALSLILITSGDTEKNFQFFSHHKVDFPVLFQRDGAIAKAYQANGTPSGYLISADGKIASPLAMGAEALLELAAQPDPLTPTLSPSEGAREKNNGDGHTGRFAILPSPTARSNAMG
jgi:peroxiredoxin